MATGKNLPLHDNVIDGMDYTTPPHLIGNKWLRQHNMRLTPKLKQIPHKTLHNTVGSDDIIHIGIIPGSLPNTGTTLLFTAEDVFTSTNVSLVSGLSTDSLTFRRWSTAFYDGRIYYTNSLNPIRVNDGATDEELDGAPSARYLTVWYDHLVVAYPTVNGNTYPNRMIMSNLYKFDDWEQRAGSEADHYDFVEWQSETNPITGVTGIGKLRGTLWIYTPTAIIPVSYVGLPKIIQVQDQGVIHRTGNTFPYTMVALDTVHFFFDYQEFMFFAFQGAEPIAIGQAVKDYLMENLNEDYTLAAKMYAYVDSDNTEIWWNFVSKDSDGDFDQAVIFNYRQKKWYTASVNNVLCFCKGTKNTTKFSELEDTFADQTGTMGEWGLREQGVRLYGSDAGQLLTDATSDTDADDLLAQDDIVLETADFHYGDIRTIKECDMLILNAYWDLDVSPEGNMEVYGIGRDFLGSPVTWTTEEFKGNWDTELQDAILTFKDNVVGRILRYKFVGKDLRDLTFSAWSDQIYMKGAEK